MPNTAPKSAHERWKARVDWINQFEPIAQAIDAHATLPPPDIIQAAGFFWTQTPGGSQYASPLDCFVTIHGQGLNGRFFTVALYTARALPLSASQESDTLLPDWAAHQIAGLSSMLMFDHFSCTTPTQVVDLLDKVAEHLRTYRGDTL